MKIFILLLALSAQSVHAQAPTYQNIVAGVGAFFQQGGPVVPEYARFCTIIINESAKRPSPSTEQLRQIITQQQGDAVLKKIKDDSLVDIYSSVSNPENQTVLVNRQYLETYCHNKTKIAVDSNPPEMLPDIAVQSAGGDTGAGSGAGGAGGGQAGFEAAAGAGIGAGRSTGSTNVFAARYQMRNVSRDREPNRAERMVANLNDNSMDDCTGDESCEVFPDQVGELEQIMGQVGKMTNVSKCPCLNSRIRKRLNDPVVYNQHREILERELKSKVATAFSKKFLNDYAANVEDVNFFSAKFSKFFGDTEKTQKEVAEELQCSQPDKYLDAINRKCGSEMTPEKMRRLDKIFGVFGSNTAGSSLADKLSNTNRIISTLDDTTRNLNGNLYTRADHDAVRFSFTRTKPEFKLADGLIKRAMNERRIKNAVKDSADIPLDSLSKELMTVYRENPAAFIEKYLSRDDVGEEYYLGFIQALKDGKDVIKDSFAYAMGLHPGMEAILLDKNLLDEASKKAKRERSSLSAALEKDDDILGKRFRETCDKLKQNLAEAVCIDEKDVLKGLDVATLGTLLDDPNDLFKRDFSRLLICEAGSENKLSPLFQDLAMLDQSKKKSDFLDRMTKAPKDQTNAFRKMVNALGDKEFKDDVRSSMEYTVGQGSSVNSANMASSAYGSGNGGVSSAFSSAIGFDEEKAAAKIAQFNASIGNGSKEGASSSTELMSGNGMSANGLGTLNPGQMDPGLYNSNMSATTVTPGATQEDKTTAQIRRELRDYMSNDTNRDQVDGALSGADPKILEELAKLKEEAARNREKLLELASENEKLKLRSVQDQLKTLEDQRAKKITEAIQAPVTAGQSGERESGSTAGINRGIASIAETAGVNSGSLLNGGNQAGAATTGGASTSGGSGAGAGSLSGDRGSASNALNAMVQSGAEPLVISSSGPRAMTGDIKSSELSLELLSYLEKNEPDIQTLMKLRNSGMIYKYRVLEDGKYVDKEILVDYKSLNEDVKKLIDQKIADSGYAGPEISRINDEIKKMRRTHSFSTLKIILGEQMRKKN